jgi:hypothetical protein
LTKQACICQGKYYLFTVDMSESLYHKLSMLAACDGAQESGYSADVVGGWIEGDERVKAIVLARIKVVENFSQTSESCCGLAA